MAGTTGADQLRWEYARVSFGSTVRLMFGRDQGSRVVDQARQFFGAGFKSESTGHVVILDPAKLATVRVLNFLGGLGWELVATNTTAPEFREVMTLKRPLLG